MTNHTLTKWNELLIENEMNEQIKYYFVFKLTKFNSIKLFRKSAIANV